MLLPHYPTRACTMPRDPLALKVTATRRGPRSSDSGPAAVSTERIESQSGTDSQPSRGESVFRRLKRVKPTRDDPDGLPESSHIPTGVALRRSLLILS